MSEQRKKKSFKYVKHLWRDEVAGRLSGLDRLVYRSNKLGEDLTLTNTGGGNTSSKLTEQDPLTQAEVDVLWVKGSGGDLRTAKRDGFASLYLDKVRAMGSVASVDCWLHLKIVQERYAKPLDKMLATKAQSNGH